MKHPLLLTTLLVLLANDARAQRSDDPYLWLEEIDGQRAMDWVKSHNQATLDLLKTHPAYDSIYRRSLEIYDSRDRIPTPSIMGDQVYNFWQDAEHVRGIWRRTSLDSYSSGSPSWETVLDLDALSKTEGKAWAWGGATCLPPRYARCLVNLSPGGSDAAEVRELDMTSRSFAADGFRLPVAKSSLAWIDSNTIYVSTDYGEGSLTTSGYPRIVKLWKRGQPLSSAREVYAARREDVWAGAATIHDTRRTYHLINRGITFYEFENYVVENDSLIRLEVPNDVTPSIVAGQLVMHLKSDWAVGGRTLPQAALISIGYEAFLRGERNFEIVAEPDERSSVVEYGGTRDLLLVNLLRNVKSELYRYRREGERWVGEPVGEPPGGTISLGSAADFTNDFFFSYQSFTQPTTLYYVRDGATTPIAVQSMPAFFDASGLTVDQFEARSKDGTPVPYFVVRREDMALNGTNPTLLYAYGGFEVAQRPTYSAILGAAWMSRGGVYVLANIRGGGEFGPRWHQSALKANRQRAFDDFIAVAEDLIARRITSPPHLGIQGGSNGGLLVGAVFTQRPELFNAVICSVPLLDMRRYHQLLAGASWMAEYGNPDDPDEWAFISRYSPYQNLVAGKQYPRVLFTTTTRDDRVHPGHARKMAAKMEGMGSPMLYFENVEGGHGSGTTNAQRATMSAVQYTYLLTQLTGRSGTSVP